MAAEVSAPDRPPLRGVYVITDRTLIPPGHLEQAVEAALRGDAALVQYRDKSNDQIRRTQEARALAALCQRYERPLIVNDDIELAAQTGADGVHLGADDASIARARTTLGPKALIGVSCYDSLQRARDAAAQGADYVAFGSLFPSPTKPQAARAPLTLLGQAREKLDVPVCAIGGIDATNAARVIAAGADLIAVISAVFGAEDIEAATRRLAALFPAD